MRIHPLLDLAPAELAALAGLPRDVAVALAAAPRGGVLTHQQLRALGLSGAAIRDRVRRKLLHVLHRGIYVVGRADVPPRGRLRAALLRCGPTAVLSHHTAAAEHGLLASRQRVAITVMGRRHRPAADAGIHLRYTDRWRRGEVEWRDGLPCTSIARTVADLAGTDERAFSRAWNAADERLLLDVGPLAEQVARRRPGCGLVRGRLERYVETPPTESELEELWLEVSDAHGLPRPVAQWPLGPEDRPGRVDFVYVDERVALELDSRKWHAVQEVFERDHEKDLLLREAGWDPHRYTYRQVRDEGPRVAAAIRRALEARRALARQTAFVVAPVWRALLRRLAPGGTPAGRPAWGHRRRGAPQARGAAGVRRTAGAAAPLATAPRGARAAQTSSRSRTGRAGTAGCAGRRAGAGLWSPMRPGSRRRTGEGWASGRTGVSAVSSDGPVGATGGSGPRSSRGHQSRQLWRSSPSDPMRFQTRMAAPMTCTKNVSRIAASSISPLISTPPGYPGPGGRYAPSWSVTAPTERTASAAWRPESRLPPPARAMAWSMVSTVSTPKPIGTPVVRPTSMIPRAASPQT